MKIAVLTMFRGLSRQYSLCNVVQDHIKMFLEHDIEVKMLVHEKFNDEDKYDIFCDERIEWIKIKCSDENDKEFIEYDYEKPDSVLHSTFADEAKVISEEYVKALSDVDVCFMHDILYQGWYYIYNVAIRMAKLSLESLRFIEFTHSFPSNRPLELKQNRYRYLPMPDTVFVYPSYSGLSALAKQYNVPEGKCRVIYNTMDFLENMSEETLYLNSQVKLLDTDILIIYPARLSIGKQCEEIVKLGGAIQTVCERSVKVVYCDFSCMDTDTGSYKQLIRDTAKNYGLESEKVIFTSDYGFKDGFPRKSVLELFTLSNLFICPSRSESFGLTVLEAASRGNFIVLNEKVPALQELGKIIKAYFMDWNARLEGENLKVTHYPSEPAYYAKNAKTIYQMMNDDRAVYAKTQVKSRYSYDWIWKNQLEPLLYNEN